MSATSMRKDELWIVPSHRIGGIPCADIRCVAAILPGEVRRRDLFYHQLKDLLGLQHVPGMFNLGVPLRQGPAFHCKAMDAGLTVYRGSTTSRRFPSSSLLRQGPLDQATHHSGAPWSFCCSVHCRVESFLRFRAFGAPQVETVLVCSLVHNCCRENRDQMSYVRVAFSALHDETVLSCHLGCWFGL